MELEIAPERQSATQPARPDVPVLLPWAAGLAIGIAWDAASPVDARMAAATLSGFAALMLFRSVRWRFGLLLTLPAAICCGAVLHHASFWQAAQHDIVHFTAPEQRLARITGTIVDEPRTASRGYAPFEPWLYQQNRTTFMLAVDGAETHDGMAPASGRVRVSVKEAALHLRSGAHVEAFGWLYRPSPPRNPGAFDWSLFQARRGVRANLSCERGACVRVLDDARGPAWWSRANLRMQARRLLLDERLARGGPDVSVLDAMVLGRRGGMDRSVESAFIATGCAHYLAVSGMHVGMLALVVWIGGRLVGWSKRRTAFMVMLLVVLYALVADPRPPILRATIMVVALGTGIVLRRPRSLAASICLAAIAVLVSDPPALFDLGFQLSFLAVIGILALHPAVMAALTTIARTGRRWVLRERPVTAEIERIALLHAPRGPLHRVTMWIGVSLAVALAAWLSGLPIVASGFGYIAPWGWLNSLLAFPLVFAVMVTGFARVALGALLPPIGGLLDPALDGAVRLLLGQLTALSALPGTRVPVPPPPAWLIVLYYAGLAAIAARARGYLPRRTGSIAAAVVCVCIVGWWWGGQGAPDGVRITQLAVGRGTSTVIELPDGNVWLYDAGASGNYDPGAGVIVPYLHHRGIRRLAGIIISHPNLDHFGGVPSLIDAVASGPVYLSPHFARQCNEDGPCAVLLEWLEARGHPIVLVDADETLQLGDGVIAEALWPPSKLPLGLDVNDGSLVLRLCYGTSSVLFTGDIGYVPQQWLMDHADPTADVLVLPHHGSVEANTRAFIQTVGASMLVRSTFTPSAESPALTAAVGNNDLYNTADVGAVEISLGREGIEIHGSRAGAAGAGEPKEQ